MPPPLPFPPLPFPPLPSQPLYGYQPQQISFADLATSHAVLRVCADYTDKRIHFWSHNPP